MAERVSDALLRLLGEWEGFKVERVETPAAGDGVFGAPRLCFVLVLRAKTEVLKRCSQRSAIVDKIHDVSERRARDLPFGEWNKCLVFSRVRLECPRCGSTVHSVPWLNRYWFKTTRLAEKIALLALRLGAAEEHLHGI